ncbi:MAG: type II toxin-antitoxin system RelE/ParE family toxin [Chlamydiales bacterium]
MQNKINIDTYETKNGKCPYLEWESKLSKTIRAIVTTRLARIRVGNFGDCKSIQGAKGMYERRIHISPGYRIYFGKDEDKIILLLLGGIKGNQKKDIQKSYEYWQDYLVSKWREYEKK